MSMSFVASSLERYGSPRATSITLMANGDFVVSKRKTTGILFP